MNREFLQLLEKKNLLKRIQIPVSSELEISEIVQQLYQPAQYHPAIETPVLLFENVEGSKFPLLINLLGHSKTIELLLKESPAQIGKQLAHAVHSLQKAGASGGILKWIWTEKDLLLKLPAARPKIVKSSEVKQVIHFKEQVNLFDLPILKCWPLDGGKFITAGLVVTKSPMNGARNMGVYRLQVHSKNELLLHWQIQKGGGFHYLEAESLNQPLEVAIVIGADPLLWLAGIFPLPESADELAFAGLISGKSVPLIRCETLNLDVPASAEFIIEGLVHPKRREMEGPFGDHFGHYSHAFPFPVLEVQCITHKKNAIYHAAVVGKPPQEDKAMGDTVTDLFMPIVKLLRPELEDFWAYYEAGFHNLLVVSVHQRYGKESIKTALSLLGEGQLSLTKCIILVDPKVNVRDFSEVLRAIHHHFNPQNDFILLPGTSQDTLDFTGKKLNYGSKMIMDATANGDSEPMVFPLNTKLSHEIKNLDPNVEDFRLWEDTLLVVKTKGEGKSLLQKLIHCADLQSFKIIAVVSADVPLESDVLLLWGIFTRFDCESDILFSDIQLKGIKPIYQGPVGIDATWKQHYPKPVEMNPAITEYVKTHWPKYGLNKD